MLFSIYNSYLYYENIHFCVNTYFNSIVKIIKKILENNPDMNVNIWLCHGVDFSDDIFNNSNKLIKISLNCEHTIVKKGGRDTDNVAVGNIMDDNDDNYLVRIVDVDKLSDSNIILEYSEPNIFNITNSVFNYLKNKLLYISPSLYNFNNNLHTRNINVLTTFINTAEPRRSKLIENINANHLEYININNCFDLDSLYNVYINTKILINIHQTDHHHTFEELRVLPALESGVLVISEISPLNKLIPYNNLIIWSTYDDIISKTKDVLDNYDEYYKKIFTNENIEILTNLKQSNYDSLQQKILANYSTC